MQPAQQPSNEIAVRKPTAKKVLLNTTTPLITGAAALAVSSLLHLGVLGAAGISFLVGVVFFLFVDRSKAFRVSQKRAPSVILMACIFVAIPWGVLYFIARYVLAAGLLAPVTNVLIGAYVFSLIRVVMSAVWGAHPPKDAAQKGA